MLRNAVRRRLLLRRLLLRTLQKRSQNLSQMRTLMLSRLKHPRRSLLSVRSAPRRPKKPTQLLSQQLSQRAVPQQMHHLPLRSSRRRRNPRKLIRPHLDRRSPHRWSTSQRQKRQRVLSQHLPKSSKRLSRLPRLPLRRRSPLKLPQLRHHLRLSLRQDSPRPLQSSSS